MLRAQLLPISSSIYKQIKTSVCVEGQEVPKSSARGPQPTGRNKISSEGKTDIAVGVFKESRSLGKERTVIS